MRECPNCGYKDPPYWRNVRFRIFTSCCSLEDFKTLHKELGMRIEKEINVIGHGHKGQESYIYHLVKKSNIVQRIHIDDSMDGKSWREPEQEKHYKFKAQGQQTLMMLTSQQTKAKT